MGINTFGAAATSVAAAFIFHRALLVTLVWIRAQSDIRLHRKYTLAMKIQVSLARLGAGFGSALADIIPNRIPAHPCGAFISVGDCDPPLRQAGY